jgi:aminoglycoside phosphotransferase (APT) family kinase protein
MTEPVTTDALEEYLVGRFGTETVAVRDLVKHPEGWSRNTYSFTATWDDEGETTNRFVLRSEAEGGVLDTDLEKEYRVMDAAQETDAPVPRTHWYEADPDVIGAPFFVVDHVSGEAPNTWRGSDRAMLEDAWETRNGLPEGFVDAAAEVHSMSPEDVPFMENPGVDGVVERELDRWVGKYESHDLRSEPIVDEAIRWFRENPPEIDELTVVHGDFRIGNMLIDDGEITALLDWEMARLGDPMYDHGYSSMPYLAGKLIDEPTELVCAVADREWYYDRYEELTGRTVDRYAVEYWQAFAIFVMITILLTGVDRYDRGESDDVRQVWLQYPIPGLLEDLLEILRNHVETA